jgi:hypothetical protein
LLEAMGTNTVETDGELRASGGGSLKCRQENNFVGLCMNPPMSTFRS